MGALSPVFTTVGLAAVAAAVAAGGTVDITHVALGDAAYVPSSANTQLSNEKQRVPVAGGSASGNEVNLTALADGATAYWVKEIGFYLSDGTLLAIWSDPAQVIAYKSAEAPLTVALDMELSGIPAGSVDITASGVPLNLNMASELTIMATAQIDQNTLYMKLFLGLHAQGLA